jgi:simple sugar transport system permease protein
VEPESGGVLRSVGRGFGLFGRQREATVLVVAVALLLYFGFKYGGDFVSKTNAQNLLSETAAPIMIIAIGEVMLLICGEIDLSVGFTFTFAPFLMYFLITYDHFPALLAIIAALVMGLIVGLANGFLTVTLGVPSFITTLGTGFVLDGIVLTTSHAEPVDIPASTVSIGKIIGSDGWSQIIWGVVLIIVFHIVLTRTRWGLHTIATGGNQLGARESGINVGRIKYGNFVLTGVLGALVGLQTAFYTNTIDPTAGGYTPMFYAVTAAVIGGTAMLGGSGTILGAFLGAIVLATLTDGLDVAGVSANPLNIIFGAAILVAMIANVRLERIRAAGRS